MKPKGPRANGNHSKMITNIEKATEVRKEGKCPSAVCEKGVGSNSSSTSFASIGYIRDTVGILFVKGLVKPRKQIQ